MMHKTLAVLTLAITLPCAANAQSFFHGKKTADPQKVLRATADALGYDEEDVKVTDFEKDGPATRYKATLADGSVYRCSVTTAGGLVKAMSFGGDYMTDPQCVKKVGTGKGGSPKRTKNALLEAAGKQ